VCERRVLLLVVEEVVVPWLFNVKVYLFFFLYSRFQLSRCYFVIILLGLGVFVSPCSLPCIFFLKKKQKEEGSVNNE
jgi:hypothetical protein